MKNFPFTAVVGMDLAKRSLLYHAIDPKIGGILFLGHRGCAKSTLVRGFAEILSVLPPGDAPFVELPLGATEDRLVGSVNAGVLVDHGRWEVRSGLIEQANGGVLYVDEINLLPDHLADLLLDSAASGQHRMQRDGFARVIEAEYILVGTMNPDEGDLRPQLADRFAHGVRIHSIFTTEERVEIVQNRMLFDDFPEQLIQSKAGATGELVNRLKVARELLGQVEISGEMRRKVAERAGELKLEGVRAELAVLRTSRCAAAWQIRTQVTEPDLEEAWELCLGHRQAESPASANSQSVLPPPSASPGRSRSHRATEQFSTEPHQTNFQPRDLLPVSDTISAELLKWWAKPSGHRQKDCRNRQSFHRVSHPQGDIAWVATVREGILNGWRPGKKGLRPIRWMSQQRESLWCFLDASRSTGSQQFLSNARNALLGLTHSARSARMHLLLLDQAGLRWIVRRATVSGFQTALSGLMIASGKSLITPALRLLHRSRIRAGATRQDRVILSSDGLATPIIGEKSGQSWRSVRQQVLRMEQHGSELAWLHPVPRRGLSHWLDRILQGSTVNRIQVGHRR